MTIHTRCSVKLKGRHCEHDLCVQLDRPVPVRLMCAPDAARGYGHVPPPECGCSIHSKRLPIEVQRELRDNLQECVRRGYVLLDVERVRS